MGLEIERKFLVADATWRDRTRGPGTRLRQGYLAFGNGHGPTVRVRLAGAEAFLTVKGPGLLVRAEFEYAVPRADAEAMLDALCARPVVEKTRHEVLHEGALWTVDEFDGHLTGLVLAEIELDSPERAVALPAWLGREVTGDPRYANGSLALAGGPPAPG